MAFYSNTAWKGACRGPEITRFGPVFFRNTGVLGGVVVHDTRRVHRVSGIVFSPNRTFSVARKIRCPDTSMTRGVSRLGYSLILPDSPRIMACHVRSHNFFSHWEFLFAYIFDQNARYETCHFRTRYRIFHGTTSIVTNRGPEIARYATYQRISVHWNCTGFYVPKNFGSLKLHGILRTKEFQFTEIARHKAVAEVSCAWIFIEHEKALHMMFSSP